MARDRDEPRWTLRQLITEVAAQLARNYAGSGNGQVRAVPDERSVRYYTTLGLIDRPVSMRGRTALYGPRHLAQLVAIKRLQSVGKSLADIQRLLPTLDDAPLARIAGTALPARSRAPGPASRFWRTPPAVETPSTRGPERAAEALALALALPLVPGTTLTFTPSRPVTDADLEALRNAATPLVAELVRRGLWRPEKEEPE